jgi:Flp pilus assembly pilin Flp
MHLKASAMRTFGLLTRGLRLNQYSSGQTMGEYALIFAAVALVAYAGLQILGVDINGMMNSLGGNL